MMILRLWAAIREPRYDKHPAFRRILFAPKRVFPMNRRILLGGGMVAGLVLVCLLSYVVPAGRLPIYGLLPLVLPLAFLAVVVGGTGRGLRLAGSVGRALGREHDNDTFTLLATLPGGKLGVYWLILTAHVHRAGNLENTNEFQRGLTLFVFGLSTFLLVIFYLNTWTTAALRAFINVTFVVYPLIAMYYIDYVCSVVTGALVGAVTATFSGTVREAGAVAVGIFIVLQGAILWITYLLATAWLPWIASWLALDVWATRVSIAGFTMLGFYLLREATVAGLWWGLVARVGAAQADAETVTG